ncbi:MAG: hypothetical protein JSV49_00060 [Thermoplasmata archaeon]|nr:MAG: hypothetical protein JSV49_00060 [Thermoplasmata archaeon]
MKNKSNQYGNISKDGNNKSFRSKMSGSIFGFYLSTIVLLSILVVAIVIFVPLNIMEMIFLLNLFALIDSVLLYLILRAKRTLYTLKRNEIEIYGAMGTKSISYDEIESVKKSAIPSGLRLYGSTFLGGWYYLPGIGKTWVSMTNFTDGVLISTREEGKYLITPKEPERFIFAINDRLLNISSGGV